MDEEAILRKHVSRRTFLAGTGGFLAGAALGGRLLGAVGLAAPSSAEVPTWPWPYVPLDPEVVRRKGYEGCKAGGCGYGSAYAILSELQEKVGYPYTVIPSDMFRWGGGGCAGWAMLCGALVGSSGIVNLVTNQQTPILNDLYGWYCETALPTAKSDAFGPKSVQSVSGSPLCHVSLTRWSKASGKAVNSPEKGERCAKLTGDTAAKAVELLNDLHAGKFVAAYTAPASVGECMTCHGPDMLGDASGKMDCVQCHEPH